MKYVWPCGFFYITTVAPVVWVLELGVMKSKIKIEAEMTHQRGRIGHFRGIESKLLAGSGFSYFLRFYYFYYFIIIPLVNRYTGINCLTLDNITGVKIIALLWGFMQAKYISVKKPLYTLNLDNRK